MKKAHRDSPPSGKFEKKHNDSIKQRFNPTFTNSQRFSNLPHDTVEAAWSDRVDVIKSSLSVRFGEDAGDEGKDRDGRQMPRRNKSIRRNNRD